MYPLVTINLNHLRENVKTVKNLCDEHNIRITAVTKVFGGDPKIASVFIDGGIDMLGDSRTENLKLLDGLKAEKWLIRPPMLTEVSDLCRYADVSLNSEIEVIRKINETSKKLQKRHKVILMADLGDIREGYVDYDELCRAALETEKMEWCELYGIGTNLTCFSFVQPDEEKMKTLADIRHKVEDTIGRKISIVSGGNSATIDLMLHGGICDGVDNLRLGESLLFGKERAKYQYLPNTFSDVFTLSAEIVELKEKPSLPWGRIGVDSYGNSPTFVDKKIRKKAICALGKQDFDVETSNPVDDGVKMLGASSDHLMLDVTESSRNYKVGDVVELRLGYFSVMRAFTSKYVEKIYLDEISKLKIK